MSRRKPNYPGKNHVERSVLVLLLKFHPAIITVFFKVVPKIRTTINRVFNLNPTKMKKIFTLCVFVFTAIITRSQAVLNEVYPQPGNGYHEFFELYNENNSPENLDNYTLVAYYEEPVDKSGFYVIDLPNYTIPAHGYYVSASASPFDIQDQLGLTANSNWNSLGSCSGLTKWESNGSSYTQVAVPANLNDLFVKIAGSGGVFHVFLYKNGLLVNGLIAGFSTTAIPAYLKSMPDLPIDMSCTSPDFTINFNSIPDNGIEYLTNSAGSNNGYYRSSDGLCGAWLKSDQPGQHTAGQTNGLAASLNPANQLSIAAVVSQYPSDPTKALLSYNITPAPAGAFPLTVEVYTDLGLAGQWDLNDILIDTRTVASALAGNQYIILPSWEVAVIIVVKSASDCYNKTLPVGNYWSVLPVQLISFQGNVNSKNKVSLQWRIENNSTVDQFEVQRSHDGREFKTVGIVFASEKADTEDYMFYETISSFEKVMYRLKMIDKNNAISYSKTLAFQTKTVTANTIKIFNNPVADQLTFTYTASASRTIDIKVYDMSGRVLMSNKINSLEGNNMISLPLASTFKPGMYLVDVNNGSDIQTAKFVKQ